MPKKIRQLIAALKQAGFADRGGKGSHRNFKKGMVTCTVSGKEGADAKRYQEKDVAQKITEASL
ncbi:MAG: type II toxin-antitoxin system HicA family toxin [Ghiorsea sp.]|nr:type II toxin-antitoxin system HicA family toxin [Ghiorsea sp.]